MENVGAGRQEIKEVIEDQEIKYELKFERPMTGTAESVMKVDKLGDDHCKVVWAFETPIDDAQADMASGLEAELNADIDASLQNLKRVLES